MKRFDAVLTTLFITALDLIARTLVVMLTVVVVLMAADQCGPESVRITILPEPAEPVAFPIDQPMEVNQRWAEL